MFDILIRNGLVVNGDGDAGFRGDVAIQDGKIAAVGQISGEARQTIDAGGRVVAPGFMPGFNAYWRPEGSGVAGLSKVAASADFSSTIFDDLPGPAPRIVAYFAWLASSYVTIVLA